MVQAKTSGFRDSPVCGASRGLTSTRRPKPRFRRARVDLYNRRAPAAKEAFMAARTLEQRPMGALGRMTVVAGIHLAAFYFIAQGLGIVPPPTFTGSEVVLPIDEPQPQEAIPKIPVKFEESVPLVPRPVVDIDEPTDPPITADPSPVDPVSFEPTTGSAVTEAPGTSVMQDSRYPLTQPAYPPASKRDGNRARRRSRSTCCRTAASATRASRARRDTSGWTGPRSRRQAQAGASSRRRAPGWRWRSGTRSARRVQADRSAMTSKRGPFTAPEPLPAPSLRARA